MYDFPSPPFQRIGWIADAIKMTLEVMSQCEEIPAEVDNQLRGMLSLARAEAMRLEGELDPILVTIEPRARPASDGLPMAART